MNLAEPGRGICPNFVETTKLISPTLYCAADELLAISHAIGVRGVDEGHASINRVLDRCHGSPVIDGRPVHSRHQGDRAQADRADPRTRAKLDKCH